MCIANVQRSRVSQFLIQTRLAVHHGTQVELLKLLRRESDRSRDLSETRHGGVGMGSLGVGVEDFTIHSDERYSAIRKGE